MTDEYRAHLMAAYERCGFLGERVIGLAYKVRLKVELRSVE